MDPHWLDQVLSASPVITYGCRLVDGEIMEVWQSDNVERILGYSKAESEADGGGWWLANIHPEDLAAMDHILQTKGSRPNELLIYRFRHMNGTYRWLRDEKNCYPQADGTILVIGSWSDITEQKQAEESLRRSHAMLSAQQEASIDGILLVDEHQTVVGFNHRFMEIWGIPEALMNERDDSRLLAYVVPQLADVGRFREQVEYLYQHPLDVARDEILLTDGRVLERYSAPVRSPEGDLFGRAWYFRDITERKQIEDAMRMAASATEAAYHELTCKHEELKEAQGQLIQAGKMAAVGTLVAGLSHELNNPIGIILGFAQSLLKRLPEADSSRQALQAIERQAQRCGNLVRSLLDFSRKKASERQPIPPAALLERISSLATSQATQRGIQLRVAPAVPLPPVEVVLIEIESALLNIVANALDATEAGGRVELIAEASSDGVELRVSDTGSGIPAELLPKIFDPFFTTKPEGKGTGLGLSLASHMIESNGGRLTVESSPAKGTTMRVWLPAVAPSQLAESPP